MLDYTLNIPQHRKAYIYSRIESQDSFRHFFYAQNIVRIGVDYTKIIPQLPILFLYPLNKLGFIRQKKQLIMLEILLAVSYNIVIT
jgi:hypothetical protein